ncbi:hypothetical protein GF360_03800 [candidate division WWE3 bacterium]|nr:hypothetical protein [candidate division WWE3 bacterium]
MALKNKHLENKNKVAQSREGQEGQTLLFVIVALTVALSVGVSTSLRTLSSVSRTSTTDTASRVLAAAEGGVEHFLSYTTPELEGASGTCTSLESPPADCIVTFPSSENDAINSRAVVKVEEYIGDSDTGFHYVSTGAGEVNSIPLGSYSGGVSICWRGDTDVFYVLTGGADGSGWEKGLICGNGSTCYTGSTAGTVASSDANCTDSGYTGYEVTVPSGDDKSLAFVALNERGDFALEPLDGSFDTLGYRITSQGELLQEGAEVVTKVVTARRSLPHLPSGFLFGVFAADGISTN